jgi:hypothetical protein
MISLTLIREQLRWPRVRLALDACVPLARLVDIENGSATPTNDEALRIASVLDYTGSPRQLFRCVTSTGDGHHGATSTTGKQSGPQRIPVGDAGLFALVDAADYGRVSQYRWTPDVRERTTYATTHDPDRGGRPVSMHVLLSAPPRGYVCHHRDGNGLNNRAGNRVLMTYSQHSFTQGARGGTSIYKGVYLTGHSKSQPWEAGIRLNRRRYWLGSYGSETEAARAYNSAVRKVAGDGHGVYFNSTPGSRFAPIRASDSTLAFLNTYGRP